MALSVQAQVLTIAVPITTPVIHGLPVAVITVAAAPIASISLV